MGESNESWGELASYDTELAEVWDGFDRLPEEGEHEALDAFVERKRLSIVALIRIGARLSAENVLAFAFRGGIKYRDIVTDRRWSYFGSEWHAMKLVRAGADQSSSVIICEGETDGARLTELYDSDVAIMPGGAEYFPPEYAKQLAEYEIVLIGLDQDSAGDRGAERIVERLPQAIRFAPPESDWCDTPDQDAPPVPTAAPVQDQLLVTAGDLMELEEPDVVSWFEHALLPVGGLLILHGASKSYKSFLALDILAQLAQGQDWCLFEPTEEQCRVAVIQYEIPWPYYRKRVVDMHRHAREPGLFRENFLTWQPIRRPELIAGNLAQEDYVIRSLLDAKIQVLLLDPIRRAARGSDFNEEKDVSKMLRFFERLQTEGITVVSTHHDNKGAEERGGGDPLGMTGSGAFTGDPDTIISVALPRHEDRRSPRRNLYFLFRNASALGARGMEIQDDTSLLYSTVPYGVDDEDDDGPSI